MQLCPTRGPRGSVSDIQEWETFFAQPMPHDLREFILESDGPISYDSGTGRELQFLSTDDAIGYYKAYEFVTFCNNAIPICMDGSGNFAVYRVADKIDGIYAMSAGNLDWNGAVRIGTKLNELLSDKLLIEERLFPE